MATLIQIRLIPNQDRFLQKIFDPHFSLALA